MRLSFARLHRLKGADGNFKHVLVRLAGGQPLQRTG